MPEQDPAESANQFELVHTESTDLVTVARFDTPLQAHVLRSHFESLGIPAFVTDEYTVAAQPLYSSAVGGVRVKVPASYQNAAQEAIQQFNDNAFLLEDDDEKVEGPHYTDFEEALVAYTGDAHWLRRWRGLMEERSRLAGFNFFACWFPLIWFLIHGMYVSPVILGAIFFGLAWLGVTLAGGTGLLIGMLAGWLLFGLVANPLYYHQAVRAVRRVEASNLPRSKMLKVLKEQGRWKVGTTTAILVALTLLRVLWSGT